MEPDQHNNEAMMEGTDNDKNMLVDSVQRGSFVQTHVDCCLCFPIIQGFFLIAILECVSCFTSLLGVVINLFYFFNGSILSTFGLIMSVIAYTISAFLAFKVCVNINNYRRQVDSDDSRNGLVTACTLMSIQVPVVLIVLFFFHVREVWAKAFTAIAGVLLFLLTLWWKKSAVMFVVEKRI